MLNLPLDSNGRLLVGTGSPVYWRGSVGFTVNGLVSYAPSGTIAYWSNGLPFNLAGQLCTETGGAAAIKSYNGAIPHGNAGRVIVQDSSSYQTDDSFIGGLRVGRDGIYISTGAPSFLFQDDLTDLAIDASGTFTRASTAYHQQPDGTWVSIASGAPRWKGARWTGSAWSKLDTLGNQLPGPFGLLMEPADTNRIAQFKAQSLSAVQVTSHEVSTVVSPYGGFYARTVPNTVSGSHFVYQGTTAVVTDSPFWAIFSAKNNGGYNYIALEVHNGSFGPTTSCTVVVNLTTGTVAAAYNLARLDFRSEAQADGGWRFFIKTPTMGTTNRSLAYIPIPTAADPRIAWAGDGVSGALVDGVMLCLYPGTPIFTTGSAVTRAVDSLAYSGVPPDTETRLAYISGNVDVDDWNGSVPVPTAPTALQSVTVYAPGERPA